MKYLLFAILIAVICCGCDDSPEPLTTFVITINDGTTEVVGRSLIFYRHDDDGENPHRIYVRSSFGWSEKQVYSSYVYPGDTVSITIKKEPRAKHENK